MIQCKRAYDNPSPENGIRVLADRLWPRGARKEEAAPSDTLRRWFGHDADKWDEFCRRYHEELAEKDEAIAFLRAKADGGVLTLVYAAKDRVHNNAVALKSYLEQIGA